MDRFSYFITFQDRTTGFCHSVTVKRHSVIRTLEACNSGEWSSATEIIVGVTGYTWRERKWEFRGTIETPRNESVMHVLITVILD